MRSSKKQEIVTFKVDESLAASLKQIPNRSEFIRHAIMDALDNGCPLCQGTGLLTQEQRDHWLHFVENHSVSKCEDCNAVHLVCGVAANEPSHH